MHVFPEADLALDVFDFHQRVIHEDADGEGEAAEGHEIKRRPGQIETENRAQQGERYGGEDDESGAPRAEK